VQWFIERAEKIWQVIATQLTSPVIGPNRSQASTTSPSN